MIFKDLILSGNKTINIEEIDETFKGLIIAFDEDNPVFYIFYDDDHSLWSGTDCINVGYNDGGCKTLSELIEIFPDNYTYKVLEFK